MAIFDESIRETAYACVAIKTTGLTRRYDKMVEVAVALAEPGQPVRLTVDTLVNPERKVAGSEIHGIHDFNISSLVPDFEEVALDLLRQIQGRVVVGHNLTQTLQFLSAEYEELGIDLEVPFLDTMTLTSMLTKKHGRSLLEACEIVGIEGEISPTAAAAALDTARLLRVLLQKVHTMGLKRFGQMRGKGKRPFQRSLELDMMPRGLTHALEESVARYSRHERGVEGNPNLPLGLYWDALKIALTDGVLRKKEVERLKALKADLELDDSDIRMLHSRIFAAAVIEQIHSDTCDAKQRTDLAALRWGLSALGWAPGDPEPQPNEAAGG